MESKKINVVKDDKLLFIKCNDLFDYGKHVEDKWFVINRDCGYGFFRNDGAMTKGEIIDKYGVLLIEPKNP
jgi:hypothetical protein